MPTPLEFVSDFCAMWESPGGQVAIAKYFRPDTVWENHGMVTTTGVEEAIALMDGFARRGMVSISFEVLAIAADGNKVLTERIDHAFDAQGNETFAFPVMGIFEVEGDKIAAWRDYFDTAKMVLPD